MLNELIAGHISTLQQLEQLISLGSGTGNRECVIRELAGKDVQITCVDISPEMCAVAAEKGLHSVCSSVQELAMDDNAFDACLYLNSFETIDTVKARINVLNIVNCFLKKAAPLYLDVVNVNAQSGWGARVRNHFEQESMDKLGYDLGDILYRRIDQTEISYMHCYSKEEVEFLASATGFVIESIQYLDEDTGLLADETAGRILFILRALK